MIADSTPPPDWADIRAWRKTERARLIDARLAVDRERRAEWGRRIETALETRLPFLPDLLLGFYWPFKGEFDARPLVRRLRAKGGRFALPVVVEKAAPLVFRAWAPGDKLVPGVWQIPVPAEDRPVAPDALLVPLIGHDRRGYRLGYGGGYYDRTLAAMAAAGRRPVTFAIGHSLSAIPTIHPQAHDIPMDVIVTEEGMWRRSDEGLVEVAAGPLDRATIGGSAGRG